MALLSLRSAAENWLLGKSHSQLSTARLPRGLDVLRLVQFYHVESGHTLPESYKLSCEAVIAVWNRAHIPVQRIDSCIRKLSKVHKTYLNLKTHRNRQRENDRLNEDMFLGDLEELFDIAP